MKIEKKTITRRAFRYVSLVLLASFTLFPAVAHASTGTTSTSQTYVRQWGSNGAGNNQFSEPAGVAIAPNGNLYVADNANNRIVEFTSSGSYVTQWGSFGTGNTNFEFPNAVAIAANGNVYVTDTSNNRVMEFTSNGTYVTQWAVTDVSGIAIAANGNVYVTSSLSHAVYEFTSSGSTVTNFGTVTTGAGGNGVFDDAGGITIAPNGNLYITDSRGTLGDELVQELTSSGTFVTQWTVASGTPDPTGIALDSNGNVYVTGFLSNEIYEFSSSGTLLNTFGGSGTGNGLLSDPIGIATDSKNDFYVVDSGNARVQEFYLPQNLAFLTTPNSSNVVNATLPAGSNITADTDTSSTVRDGNNTYPLGLVGLTFQTVSSQVGISEQVQIVFQTSLQPNQVTPRMFNVSTNTYSNIPGAVVSSTTINGQPALLLMYSITDGGPLDEDGVANGAIVDPVGLAVNSVSAPNTGYGTYSKNNSTNIILLAVAISIILVTLGLRLLNDKLSDR